MRTSEFRTAVLEAMRFAEEEGFKFPVENIKEGYNSPFEVVLEVLDESYPQWRNDYDENDVEEVMDILNEFWEYENFADFYTETESNIEAIEEDEKEIRIGFTTFYLICDKKDKTCYEG
ncbi:hypothetical protein SAMN06269117_11438 [Balnearium lithotrophicum]|uniref:Uncharacterized protein n=1 Tax=Balnearium lithotrophicum TaxID=223788 RepID=A0A521CP79_9BACT|nr:hypothetical protein [Balnearium lithotrophicum]SMO61253.1 hypothetical protein SAMN06269117_11438 [Balnearium lithotrophicum]